MDFIDLPLDLLELICTYLLKEPASLAQTCTAMAQFLHAPSMRTQTARMLWEYYCTVGQQRDLYLSQVIQASEHMDRRVCQQQVTKLMELVGGDFIPYIELVHVSMHLKRPVTWIPAPPLTDRRTIGLLMPMNLKYMPVTFYLNALESIADPAIVDDFKQRLLQQWQTVPERVLSVDLHALVVHGIFAVQAKVARGRPPEEDSQEPPRSRRRLNYDAL